VQCVSTPHQDGGLASYYSRAIGLERNKRRSLYYKRRAERPLGRLGRAFAAFLFLDPLAFVISQAVPSRVDDPPVRPSSKGKGGPPARSRRVSGDDPSSPAKEEEAFRGDGDGGDGRNGAANEALFGRKGN